MISVGWIVAISIAFDERKPSYTLKHTLYLKLNYYNFTS